MGGEFPDERRVHAANKLRHILAVDENIRKIAHSAGVFVPLFIPLSFSDALSEWDCLFCQEKGPDCLFLSRQMYLKCDLSVSHFLISFFIWETPLRNIFFGSQIHPFGAPFPEHSFRVRSSLWDELVWNANVALRRIFVDYVLRLEGQTRLQDIFCFETHSCRIHVCLKTHPCAVRIRCNTFVCSKYFALKRRHVSASLFALYARIVAGTLLSAKQIAWSACFALPCEALIWITFGSQRRFWSECIPCCSDICFWFMVWLRNLVEWFPEINIVKSILWGAMLCDRSSRAQHWKSDRAGKISWNDS